MHNSAAGQHFRAKGSHTNNTLVEDPPGDENWAGPVLDLSNVPEGYRAGVVAELLTFVDPAPQTFTLAVAANNEQQITTLNHAGELAHVGATFSTPTTFNQYQEQLDFGTIDLDEYFDIPPHYTPTPALAPATPPAPVPILRSATTTFTTPHYTGGLGLFAPSWSTPTPTFTSTPSLPFSWMTTPPSQPSIDMLGLTAVVDDEDTLFHQRLAENAYGFTTPNFANPHAHTPAQARAQTLFPAHTLTPLTTQPTPDSTTPQSSNQSSQARSATRGGTTATTPASTPPQLTPQLSHQNAPPTRVTPCTTTTTPTSTPTPPQLSTERTTSPTPSSSQSSTTSTSSANYSSGLARNVWNEQEIRVCIGHFMAAHNEGVRGEARFGVASERLRANRIYRSPTAVKSMWNRRGRTASGFDERRKKNVRDEEGKVVGQKPLSTSRQLRMGERRKKNKAKKEEMAEEVKEVMEDIQSVHDPLKGRKRKRDDEGDDGDGGGAAWGTNVGLAAGMASKRVKV